MTVDYSPCSEKENLAVFESSNISETGEATPTKIGVHALDISPYLHEIWLFLKVAISPKPGRPCPLKLVCMHLTSIPTGRNFLSRFRSIKFFDDHGLYYYKRLVCLYSSPSYISLSKDNTCTTSTCFCMIIICVHACARSDIAVCH